MELHEFSQLLDVKLKPIVEDVAEIRSHLFGNGNPGHQERIRVIEERCAARAGERERAAKTSLAMTIAVAGWILTLLAIVVDNFVGK